MRTIHIGVIILFLTSGCASHHYFLVKEGKLQGKLIVRWIDYNKFIFIPDNEEPLTFIRHNKEFITPGRMYTDGGSIPKILWAIKNYSPWGYAPAFIIHDWLFLMKHCKLPGYENYDVKKAAWIMSEIIKTLMENPEYGGKNVLVLYSMHEAVKSKIAQNLWEDGECNLPTLENLLYMEKKPLFEYVIDFKTSN